MRKRVQFPPGLRILCVDCSKRFGDRLGRRFHRAGHRVAWAGNGEAAWTKLAKNLNFFDVVVTEHQLPRLDGLGLVERLRNAHYPGRIVVLGASLGPAETKAYRYFAVDAILRKGAGESGLPRIVGAFYAARWAALSG